MQVEKSPEWCKTSHFSFYKHLTVCLRSALFLLLDVPKHGGNVRSATVFCSLKTDLGDLYYSPLGGTVSAGNQMAGRLDSCFGVAEIKFLRCSGHFLQWKKYIYACTIVSAKVMQFCFHHTTQGKQLGLHTNAPQQTSSWPIDDSLSNCGSLLVTITI